MKALLIRRYGGQEVVEFGEHPAPDPRSLGAGEVLVQMRAASVNPIDYKTRSGAVKALLPYRMPLILGSDIAGDVLAVGPGVTQFSIGDRVAARLNKARIGSFAEQAVASVAQLAHLPASVNYAQGAAVALAGLTAWQCVTEILKLQVGQRVLIHAGAGGVGHLAIQLAKRQGAHVTTTASTANHAWLQALGADVCVDYKTQCFSQCCAPFDAVLDSQGGAVLLRSIAHTVPGGAVVSIGDLPTPEVAREFGKPLLAPVFWWLSRKPRAAAQAGSVRYRYWFMREDGAQLATLLELLAQGQLHVQIAQCLSLAQAKSALALSEGLALEPPGAGKVCILAGKSPSVER